MKIHCIYGISYDSNIFIVTGKKPTIIDCGTGLHQKYVEAKVKEIIDPTTIENIVLTHEHYDHCGGIRKIHKLIDKKAKVYAHINAANKIEKGDSDFARMLGGTMPKIPVDVKLNEGDKLKLGDEEFMVLHTPGHTPGCICLYSKNSKSLFSGDTIFSYGSFGRYDFPGGSAKQLRQSIERLAKLDVENLYPGHESIVEGNAQEHIMKTLENSRYMIL